MLEQLINRLLDAFVVVDPARILTKSKLHTLTHLPQNIRRFGLAVRYSTEVFESYNSVFRMCSVLSNRQAPSRDVGTQMADVEQVAHVLSGGLYKFEGKWIRGGEGVRKLLDQYPTLKKVCGLASDHSPRPGTLCVISLPISEQFTYLAMHTGDVQLYPVKTKPAISWGDSPLPNQEYLGEANPTWTKSLWRPVKTLVSRYGDVCKPLSWVFYRGGATRNDAEFQIGRIHSAYYETLEDITETPSCLVLIERFIISPSPHPLFDMPSLSRPPVTSPQKVLIGIQESASSVC